VAQPAVVDQHRLAHPGQPMGRRHLRDVSGPRTRTGIRRAHLRDVSGPRTRAGIRRAQHAVFSFGSPPIVPSQQS